MTPPTTGSRDARTHGDGTSPRKMADRATEKKGSIALICSRMAQWRQAGPVSFMEARRPPGCHKDASVITVCVNETAMTPRDAFVSTLPV